jgi:hypothetical protein
VAAIVHKMTIHVLMVISGFLRKAKWENECPPSVIALE